MNKGKREDEINGLNGERGKTSVRVQPFRSFKVPIFRLYFAAMMNQHTAMNMQRMVRALLIYRLTGSAAILGAMSFAHAIPMLAFSLFGGVIADRMQKKNVIFVSGVSSAMVSAAVGLSLHHGYLSADRAGSWWILVVASVIQGTVMALTMPSRQSILPEIVGEEHLMNAVSLNVMGMNFLRLFAPAAAGFLIDTTGFKAVYFTMTAMYAAAALLVVNLPRTSKIEVREDKRSAFFDLKEGLNYLRKETTLLMILVFTLTVMVLSMPYIQLLSIFADDVLKVGATGMGIMLSVSGIGALFGSFVLASLPNKKRGLLLLLSGLLMGAALAAFSFSRIWSLSLFLIVFVGLAQTSRATLGNTLLQYYVQDEFRGRVMSIYLMEFGLVSFGTFVAGLLSEAVNVQWALGSFGIALAIIALAALIFLPRIRKLD